MDCAVHLQFFSHNLCQSKQNRFNRKIDNQCYLVTPKMEQLVQRKVVNGTSFKVW